MNDTVRLGRLMGVPIGLHWSLVAVVGFFGFELSRGQTIGKRMYHLRVLSVDGSPFPRLPWRSRWQFRSRTCSRV